MAIRTIPLSRLEKDPRGTLNECAESGDAFVIELSEGRLVAIQAVAPGEDSDDSLISDLLQTNAAFRDLVSKSKASSRKPLA